MALLRLSLVLVVAVYGGAAFKLPWQKEEQSTLEEVLEDDGGLVGLLWPGTFQHMCIEVIARKSWDGGVRKSKLLTWILRIDEEDWVELIAAASNLLYVLTIAAGFLLLPRMTMLRLAALSLLLGPLVALACVAVGLGALAFAADMPLTAVLAICLVKFASTKAAQTLGLALDLDADGDGDVDPFDFLLWASCSRAGRFLGLDDVCESLRPGSPALFEKKRAERKQA